MSPSVHAMPDERKLPAIVLRHPSAAMPTFEGPTAESIQRAKAETEPARLAFAEFRRTQKTARFLAALDDVTLVTAAEPDRTFYLKVARETLLMLKRKRGL